MAYELELPAELQVVRFIFHSSVLKNCLGDTTSIVPLDIIVSKYSLSYEDVAVEILDRKVRRLRNKEVASINILCRSL